MSKLENQDLENLIHEYIASREFFNHLKEINPEAFSYSIKELKEKIELLALCSSKNSDTVDYRVIVEENLDKCIALVFSRFYSRFDYYEFMLNNSAVIYEERKGRYRGGVVVNKHRVHPVTTGPSVLLAMECLKRAVQEEQSKLNSQCAGFKFFWIGDYSDIFAANSIEDLKTFDGLDNIFKYHIKQGDFGEFPPNHRVVDGFDSCFTLYELLGSTVTVGMVEINPDKTLNHPVRIWSSDSE